MIDRLPFIKRIMLAADLFFIPKEYQSNFQQVVLNLNLLRQKVISIILFAINIILIFIDITKYKALSSNNPGYKNLFHAHLILFFVVSIYLLIIYLKKEKIDNLNYRFKSIFSTFITFFILSWCTYLSINAQVIHQQISAYIIGIFCVASLLIITPYKVLIIYILQYMVFLFGQALVYNSFQQLSGNIINSSILTILALSVSFINYSTYVSNFTNKMIVLRKNEEINTLYKTSEENLNMRTQELTKANERLINEINIKHGMEMEIMKASLLIKQKEQLLNETKKYEELRTAFFTNISHELKTPLTIIFSAEQMLDFLLTKKNVLVDSEEISKYMNSIKLNCFRLLRLIGNLLDVTRVDAKHFELDLKNNDIVEIVEEATLSVAKYIEDKNIDLIFDTETEEKIIAFDSEKIERVILNLLSNAVKFTPQGGSINVNIYEKNDNIIITVKDTGIGIPNEMKAAIFERFVQVDKSIRRNQEGSGIGLSLVKSIIEMHNGNISVVSEYGKGSEFIIKLPNTILHSDTPNDEQNIYVHHQSISMIDMEFSDITI